MKTLFTERLNLVPFKLDILQAAVKGNAEFASYLGVKILPDWQSPKVIEDLSALVDILCSYPAQNEWGWGSLVIHRDEQTLIGHVLVKVIPDSTFTPTDSLEMGYIIAESHRGQGYAFEATKAIVDFAFSLPSVQSVTAGCYKDNIASRRILEKIGLEVIASPQNALIWKLCKTATVQ
ncbi:GNAT family N-acetyltransferase [Nostoc sp. FACHB-190]|uniref:GNAT family N-acetyltransferase n=1 Tax=Nostoc sp. FACHB-190 TaxID=2692838 RepID=UPI001685BEA5|nr:GNAT family N-acetyltransferase [Nostoc sp. FACHB-190]MBD2299209.1 GNAT family N-acetyltransferase [Nostoc sp. FACHB-190]